MKKVNLSATLKGKSSLNNNLESSVRLLEEKIARELGISLEELRERVIKVKNGEVSVEEAIKEKK